LDRGVGDTDGRVGRRAGLVGCTGAESGTADCADAHPAATADRTTTATTTGGSTVAVATGGSTDFTTGGSTDFTTGGSTVAAATGGSTDAQSRRRGEDDLRCGSVGPVPAGGRGMERPLSPGCDDDPSWPPRPGGS
jgi:hypothetical protein